MPWNVPVYDSDGFISVGGAPDPPDPPAEGIIWDGSFSEGDFRMWDMNNSNDYSDIQFHQCPDYGRPQQFGTGGVGTPGYQNTPTHTGNDDLMTLCSITGAGIYEQAPAAAITNWSSHTARL